MTTIFTPGDRVVQKGQSGWSNWPGRTGMVLAGPGARLTSPNGSIVVIGAEFAAVQFDDLEDGKAEMARLEDLKLEDPS